MHPFTHCFLCSAFRHAVEEICLGEGSFDVWEVSCANLGSVVVFIRFLFGLFLVPLLVSVIPVIFGAVFPGAEVGEGFKVCECQKGGYVF